jgi:hypothetical protein
MKNIKIALIILLFSSSSFGKIYEMTENGADVKIPIKIWELLGNVEGKDTINFAAAQIRLVEMRGTQGTFKVFFELAELQDNEKLHAFFISRAKKRRIDGEVWGAGCNKYMDIKWFLLNEGKTKGFEVNTTRHRHLSVLGGTFFFAMAKQVTQVTFIDSQQSHLFCENTQVK